MVGDHDGPRTHEELVAACLVHGRSPFNDKSIEATKTDASDETA